MAGGVAYVSRALVFLAGSSGRNLLYSSTSFSMARTSACSLARSEGSVSRMWLVRVWGTGQEEVCHVGGQRKSLESGHSETHSEHPGSNQIR